MLLPRKPNYTVDTCFAEIDQIRKSLKNAKEGYREEKYKMLKSCQRVIDRLLGNKTIREAFIAKIKTEKKKSRKRRTAKGFDLAFEVVAKASGERKLAHKYARCLDYLRELDVDVEDTVGVLKKKGGIEATYRKYQVSKNEKDPPSKDRAGRPPSHSRAAKKRQPSPPSNDKVLAAGRNIAATKISPTTIDFDKPAPNNPLAGHNDREVCMPIWMKLSERDRILESKIGARWTLSCVRVNEDDGDLKLSAAMSINNAAEDWADVI